MFWPVETRRLRIGPDGLWMDGKEIAGGPLAMESLPQAMSRLSLPPRSRLSISVADSWVKTMLLDIPSAIRRHDELVALARHRFEDNFSAFDAKDVIVLAQRRHAPWPGAPWKARGVDMPVAAMDPRITRACMGWAQAAGVRVTAIGTEWGWALAATPSSAQGALASYRDGRMTVGAWSCGRWLGWRSFLAVGSAAAVADLKAWLAGLHWAPGRVPVWCAGWPVQEAVDQKWHWRYLPADGRVLRKLALDFKGAMPGPTVPLRHKVIAAAGIATMIGAIVVSLPEHETEPAAEAVVSASRRPVERPVAAEPVAVSQGEQDVRVIEDEVVWPSIQGSFTQAGVRWLLYAEEEEIKSVRQGAVVGGRFRVEQATPWWVVLRDLKTGEQRKTSLEYSGAEP